MFAASAGPVDRPAQWRSNSYHNATRSPHTSPPTSRRSSMSSVTSAKTDPGLFSDQSRQSSTSSTATASSTKSGFRTLFGKRDKKPKEKKDIDKLVLTSKHAAKVKTRMMMDPRYKNLSQIKTAETSLPPRQSSHLTAAQQEARHPHSGPPALHASNDMPSLTRIISGDEQDEEDEMDKLERRRLEWDMAKQPGVARIKERQGSESGSLSSESLVNDSDPELGSPGCLAGSDAEEVLQGIEPRRPVTVAKNSHGGRFRKDEKGYWTKAKDCRVGG